ncbi:zf-NPL4-domain-containing protein, partial [Caulochytrium protostelioides]
MLVRICSPTGQYRLEVAPDDSPAMLYLKAASLMQSSSSSPSPPSFDLTMNKEVMVPSTTSTLAAQGLKHGDRLFVLNYKPASAGPAAGAGAAAGAAAAAGSSNGAASTSPDAPNDAEPISSQARAFIVEEPIDMQLEKASGTIVRSRSRLCTHGTSGMCEHCVPLEPYDAAYQREHKIKHISYHAYLRQVRARNRTLPPNHPRFLPPLDAPSFRVKVPCPSGAHPSYPASICTKCQPSALTLQPQQFRMVDHVEFQTPALIEPFLQFWRTTGAQRFAFLIGHYQPYEKVPLGIKAVVTALYEPPQHNAHDTLQLLLDTDA